MGEKALRVSGVSKRYRIGAEEARHDTFVGRAGALMKAPLRNFRRLWGLSHFDDGDDRPDVIWALRDISFDVKEGETLGIIGRNGAGKSTLLKVLSRITEPTAGRVEIRGRVSSLLEVGTGFHQELTGRENTYLNGAILGMNKKEIDRKFEQIVEFSGVEKFIDTPVKRYSSGMKVRLAFSVAAHLEPEILIVDEVLAVGDSVFQQKCIERMARVSRSGRTVVFVSHNLAAVKALCHRAIILDNGVEVFDGPVEEAVNTYMDKSGLVMANEVDLSAVKREGYAHQLILDRVRFLDHPIPFGTPIRFKVKLRTVGKESFFPDLDFGINVFDPNYSCVIHCANRFIGVELDHTSDEDEYVFEVENNLRPGVYSMTFFLRTKDVIQDWLDHVCKIEIGGGNPYGYNDTRQIQGSTLPAFGIRKEGTPESARHHGKPHVISKNRAC